MIRNFSQRIFLFLLLIPIISYSCRRSAAQPNISEETPLPAATTTVPAPTPTLEPEAFPFQSGRNEYILSVDNSARELIVYVPAGYDASQPTPVLFMFHGSNQGGNLMVENTTWATYAERQNFIAVFPTSWEYPLIDEPGRHEKWNDASLSEIAQPGTELKDDVKFVREMIAALKVTFNVDEKRIFASGFSNGGLFVTSRLAVEMHDVFAAFAVCGSGTRLQWEGVSEDPFINAPTSIYSVMGTNDDKVSEATGLPLPLPGDEQSILADEIFGLMLTNTSTMLSLDPAQYTLIEEPAYTGFIFDQSTIGADNEYIFLMVKNMGHVYPSGNNNRYGLDVTPLFWEFFMKHARK